MGFFSGRKTIRRSMREVGFPILLASATAIVTISLAALLGWAINFHLLASWVPGAVPMAPVTACCFLVSALLLVMDDRWPTRVGVRASLVLAALVIAIESGKALVWSASVDELYDALFVLHDRVYAKTLDGRMSPLAAVCFLLSSLFLLLCALNRWTRVTRIAADCQAMVIFWLSAFPLIGYLHATPILYGGQIVPIALPSTVLFLLLSVAMMAHAPSKSYVIELFRGGSTRARLIRSFLPSITLLILAVSLTDAEVIPRFMQTNPAVVYSLSTMVVLAVTMTVILIVAPKVGRDLDSTQRALLVSQGVAAAAFESSDGIAISDANCVIERVNRAFCEITGYTAEEAIGCGTDLLKSGSHEDAFYAEMWQSIKSTGSWSGEILNRHKDGRIHPHWLSVTTVRGEDGEVTHYVSTLTDITLRKKAEEEIRNLAFFDPLTHLPNRRLLLDRLQHALASSARNHRKGALLFLDLDDFKTLNDTLGHNVGDELLAQVAERLIERSRKADTVGRLGGDEFVVLLEGLSSDAEHAAAETKKVGDELLRRLEAPYVLSGHEHRSTVSIGAALFGEDDTSIEETMKRADIAMYKAKTEGRNSMRFFDQDLEAAVLRHAALEKGLRRAIAEGEFLLYFQPQVDHESRVTGAETLLRWQHPVLGLVSPKDFIPLAEETGLILPLGRWVMEKACEQLVTWAKDEATAHLSLSVNVSAKQIQQPDFVEEVLLLLARTHASPQRLKLELTETVLLNQVESIIEKMTALNERGVRFSLDDFGTGYSSLSYLGRLPLSQLKIDQVFVRDLLVDSKDAMIARTIIALAQSLDLRVIAEGVENWEQVEHLKSFGCRAFQGFLFGRPVPIEEFGYRECEKS